MKDFFNIIKILILIDFLIAIFCLLSGNLIWLYNTQLAFFSTTFIIIGSFIGYSNLVKSEVERGNIGDDILKKYEDPYDLDEEEKIEIKEIKPKKLKWYEAILFSFKGGINFIRISGYIFLIASFLWLSNNGFFDVLSFLIGVSVVPLISLFYLLSFRFKVSKGNKN